VDRNVQIRVLLVAVLPALLVGVIFELFLGHRHDYTGHYAAGFGATYCIVVFALRLLASNAYYEKAQRILLPICVICIAAGAVTEATIFRIARFDEIDFFNQSLGAVLAVACATAYVTQEKLPETVFEYGLVVGIAFLGIGGCFAVA
jgi:hypothetical protein